MLPEGWSIKDKGESWQIYVHMDGSKQVKAPEGSSPVGAIALADAIKNNGALTCLNISGNNLTNYGQDMSGIKALAAAILECK